VADQGDGIPPEIADKVMDPFFTTKLDSGGTGLGLSISQAIIRAHKGSLTFTSLPGQGTKFLVKLPTTSILNRGDIL
jgi:signal transduction histidine kinase